MSTDRDGFEEIGLPPLGHNRPPADEPGAAALKRADELVHNANRWIAERSTIADDEQAGACQLNIDQLRAVEEDLKSARKAEYDAIIDAMHAKYRDPLALIDIALGRLLAIASDWLVRKRDKANAEAAERKRLADEAIAKANAAIEQAVVAPSVHADLAAQRATDEAMRLRNQAERGAERPRIKGDYASKAMSLRETWRAKPIEGEDVKAIRAYAKHPTVMAAALKAATSIASNEAKRVKREDAAPPGWRFFKTEKAV